MKTSKKIVSVILVFVILICSISLVDFSQVRAIETEEDSITENTEVNTTENESEEYIYYSDLFYGYSYYLSNAPFLTSYFTDTQGILNQIYDDYMNSPNFLWTDIKHSLAMATSIKEWTKMIMDASGLTSFTYEKALDAANVDFATKLTGGSDIAKAYGTELKWVKKINDILKIYDTFDKNYDINRMTETEVFSAMFTTIGEANVLVGINKTTLITLEEVIIPNISTITSKLSKGADILTAAKTIATGIMMEDFRMELIDEILSSTTSGTMLYDGMNRLKIQLRDGFVSYFFDQYLSDKVLNELADKVVKQITSSWMDDYTGLYSLIGAITKVASWIVFDCIFDVPDIDDLTKQMVLSEYSICLYSLLSDKLSLFDKQFKTDDIFDLEILATAYSAATNAALSASDKLKLDKNEDNLKTVLDKYADIVFYNEWIDSAKCFVKIHSFDNRIITHYDTWEITYETAFLRNSSDTIENGTLYFLNHNFYGNIDYVRYYEWAAVLYGTITIPQGEKLVINGNFTLLADGHAYLENYGELTVNGRLSYSYNASFLNTGIVNINNTGETALQIPTENNGKMIINGNCYDIRENSGELRVYGNASLWNNSGSIDVSGDVSIGVLSYERVNDGSLNVGRKLTVAGRLSNNGKITADSAYIEAQSCIYNNNTLTVRNDIDFDVAQGWYGLYYGAISMNKEDAVFELGGNFNGLSSNCSLLNDGTLMLNGEKQQQLSYLNAKNIIVNNVEGIRYLTGITVTGEYLLNGYPLDNNGYLTNIRSESVSFDSVSDYKTVSIPNDSNFVYLLKDDFIGNIYMSAYGTLRIPTNSDVTVCGNITLGNEAKLAVEGELKVIGNVICDYGSPGGWINLNVMNRLDVSGDLIMRSEGYDRAGVLKMNNENSELHIGGDFKYYYHKIYDPGTIVFDGNDVQNVYSYASHIPTIIIDNPTRVVFESAIYPSTLFDHKGNSFTLYNNGTGSTFVDYDGDGMKDNVDPEPTVGNPCVLYFESEDSEKGTVSLIEVETVGGTKITVMATPTSKYDFSKWVNSAGESVSTSAEYTFVAKGDDAYTAVFTKRQQPITVETTGGQIKVPSSAEIESEVSISITESAGYVFTVGSLKYNGNAIENGKFIMPDEPVVITAEFIRNENYFNLKEKLDEAKDYTYNDYSKESFAALTAAIKNAQDSLVNNILEEKSIEQITALQNAINNLQNKYITEIKFNNTPVLYYGVQEMINDISLSVIYDNGTKETITASQCSVSDYDSLLLGSQNITITYAEFTQTLEVTTQPRLISDCDVAGLTDKVFDGIKDDYTQELILTYSRTSDILVEGIDYRISYTDNSEIGTATVILEGIGNYSGKKILPFDIYCEHDFVLDYTVESTCSEKGRSVYKCNICSGTQFFEYVVTENLPESDHNYSNYYDKTYEFSYDGADKLGLLFSTKTYTENGFDKIYIYDSENTLIGTYSGSQLSGKTVVVDGSKVRIRLTSDHSYSAYGFSLDSITAYFSYISLPLAEHEFSDWSTTQEATCTATGEQKRSCIYCETEEYQVIDITEHTGSEERAENIVEATCEENGYYDSVIYCVSCSKELSRETKEITVSGHKEETIPAVNPSCTEIGLTEGKKCSICNKILLEQTPIELKGHDYNAVVTVPTCTEQGYTTYTCECGDSYVADYVKENGHSHTAEVTTPATHLTEGIITYTCTCGDTYTEAIAKTTEHKHIAVVTAPTCIEKGFTTYTCECGDCYVDNITGLADHTDGDGDEFCDYCDEYLGSAEENNCSHMCHKDGFMGFIWKIVKFFWKLFGMNPVCECGAAHY